MKAVLLYFPAKLSANPGLWVSLVAIFFCVFLIKALGADNTGMQNLANPSSGGGSKNTSLIANGQIISPPPFFLFSPDLSITARTLYEQGHGFLALVVLIENADHDLQRHPFLDGGSTPSHPLIDLGFGYCVSERIGTKNGERSVRNDLRLAGFSPRDIRRLLSQKPQQYSRVRVTPRRAIRLLFVVESEYQKKAQDYVGKETWDHLPQNQKDALAYLGYNTGFAPDIPRVHGHPGKPASYSKLKIALQNQDLEQILENATSHIGKDKKRRLNYRLMGYLMYTMLTEETARETINFPTLMEAHFKTIISPYRKKPEKKQVQLIACAVYRWFQMTISASPHRSGTLFSLNGRPAKEKKLCTKNPITSQTH